MESPQINQSGNGGERATPKSVFDSRGNFGGNNSKAISYHFSGGTYEGIFKVSIFFETFSFSVTAASRIVRLRSSGL